MIFSEIIFDGYNAYFLTIIAILFLADLFSGFDGGKNHFNFGGVMVAVGIIGTFFGIFIGLIDFDTSDVQGSIPGLLEGLKTAFVTSIAGLIGSTSLEGLRVIYPIKFAKSDDPNHLALVRIEEGFNSFSEKSLEHQKSFFKEFVNYKDNDLNRTNSLLDLNARLVDSVESGFSATMRSFEDGILSLRSTTQEGFDSAINASNDHADKIVGLLDESFTSLKTLLKEALDEISSGASEEIIKALEDVIKDFNNKLTEQFGENFQALNEACLQLVNWQEEYRHSMIQNEKNIITAREALEKSNEAVENSDKVISQSAGHIEQINEMGKKWEVTLEQIQGTTESINNQLENEESLLGTIDQVLESAQENLSTVVTKLTDSQDQLDDLVKNTQNSFNAHADQIKDIAEESGKLATGTQQQLNDALTNLENSLISLTKQFSSNYSNFIEGIERIMPTANV